MFKIVNSLNEPDIWCATDGSTTYRIGQLVTVIGGGGSTAAFNGAIRALAVPVGAADTTNKQVVYGVITGFNNRLNPTFDSTGEYATGVLTKAAQLARDWAFAEGMYIKGDPQVLVSVERIFPHSIIRGSIYNGTLGTAPTVVADTGGSDSTGYTSAGTTGACDFTPVANLASIYCRSGANAGMIRTTGDTSKTGPVATTGFPNSVALGDKFVRVPLCQGFSMIYIAGPGLYIDASELDSGNTFHAMVHSLRLDEAGKETADFSFSLDHFCYARA